MPAGDSLRTAADTLTQINVSIFPNPSNSTFTITITGSQQARTFQLSIAGIDGSTLYNGKGQLPGGGASVQQVWDATSFADGIYFYTVKIQGSKTVSGKLVKI